MELLILTGVLVAGIGVGLSFNGRGDVSPIVCHCECSGEKTSPVAGGNPFRDIFLSWVVGLICGGASFVLARFWWQSEGIPVSPKGKGKRGVYGTGIPLQITG